MTEKQERSKKRNWNKYILAGLTSQLKGISTRNTTSLTLEERLCLAEITDVLDGVLMDWNTNTEYLQSINYNIPTNEQL